jgi:hypothetical protein
MEPERAPTAEQRFGNHVPVTTVRGGGLYSVLPKL